MEVDIGFSMLKKQRTKHRRGQDMSKKSEHDKVEKKRNMPKKQRNEKEDRRKGREEKGPKLHATTW